MRLSHKPEAGKTPQGKTLTDLVGRWQQEWELITAPPVLAVPLLIVYLIMDVNPPLQNQVLVPFVKEEEGGRGDWENVF